MVSKHFLTTAILGAAALLFAADANSFAAGHGGGGGGHGGGGYGGGRGGYGGGYGRGGYGYGGFYGGGFYGGGLFYGDYLLGGGYPGYYAPYAYPAPSYYSPDPYYPPRVSANPSISYYAGPATAANPAVPTSNSASIHVVLPDPQATVLFDGRPTSSTGTDRSYHTPDLAPGGSYQYKLRVSWMQDGNQVSEERLVTVTPGRTTDVVFDRVSSGNAAAASVAK